MGLSQVYQEMSNLPGFLTSEQRGTMVREAIPFMINKIAESTSKITGRTQYIFNIQFVNETPGFPGGECAFSLEQDVTREAIVAFMKPIIDNQGFYGPVTLGARGRYYVLNDAPTEDEEHPF